MAVFIKTPGNRNYLGTAAEYDQVDYPGEVTDYVFTRNADGTITVEHAELGTDTLTSIEGFWFQGESAWYSADDAIAASSGEPGPTVTGTAGDDALEGTDIDNIFIGSDGDDTIDGNGGAYNQIDYRGALEDYIFQNNADGSVSVYHPEFGTDIVTDIDGFWFQGEAAWYSLADAIDIAGGEIPAGPLLNGTDGDDILTGSDINNTFIGSDGDDVIDGNGGAYNQLDYSGALEDYTFTENADGTVSVSHATQGTDNITDIDGIWFQGEGAWYSLAGALEASATDPTGGTMVDGVYTGTNDADTLVGSSAGTNFYSARGNDSITGIGLEDVLNVDGDAVEWTFSENADGTTSMSHAMWGIKTLDGIDMIVFGRSGESMTIEEAIAATDGLPEFRMDADGVLNGTPGDDIMTGTAQTDFFYGGVGDDSYDGAGGFDQINYDGERDEYEFTQNADGTVTVEHDVWGTDTIENIEGLYFAGNGEWVAVGDLFGGA